MATPPQITTLIFEGAGNLLESVYSVYLRINITLPATIELGNMAEDEEGEGLNLPLIDDRLVSHDDDDGDNNHEYSVSSLNLFIWKLTFTAGISGLLFGYEFVRPSLSVLLPEKKSFGLIDLFPLRACVRVS